MRKTLPAAFILVAFLFFFVSSSFAEIKTGAYSFSPFAGGYLFEGNENLKNKPISGLRLGYDFTKNWGVEGLFEFTKTEYGIPALTSRTNVFGYRLEALYNFMPENRWVPYLAVGAGGRSLGYDHPQVNNRNQVALDYGAGLKYFLYSNVALRGDVRHIITLNDRFNNLEYTLGVTVYFGGPKPARVSRYEPIAATRPEPELRPISPPPPPPPIVEEKVVIIVAEEPKVEEKVMVAAAAAAVEPKIIILAFEDVHFDFDKSTLKPEAQTILKKNIQLLKDNPKAQIRVAGYTSASGTEAYNQKLSERRAKAVQEYLINEGVITPDRLSTIGYGESNPAVYEVAPKELYSKAAKANMRVLFEIIVK